MRYTPAQDQIFLYQFIQGGKEYLKWQRGNTTAPCLRTMQRKLAARAKSITEGEFRLHELIDFLQKNNLPMDIVLSEDATKINGRVEYDYTTKQVRGLVGPMNKEGMPQCHIFKATDPASILRYLNTYPVGRNVYVVMAQPHQIGAPPFCVQYFCTDNRFTTEQVSKRWKHFRERCDESGVRIISISSDGDPRPIGAMIEEMGMPNHSLNEYGDDFIASTAPKSCPLQDPTHKINKLRTRMMKKEVELLLG